jgi:hypothetical protein
MAGTHDDREIILREIDQTIEEQQARLRSHVADYAAGSSGARLPVIVNAAVVVTAIVVALILRANFVSTQDAYVLRAAGGALGADIVAALLAETETALSEKETAIARLRGDLDTVNSRLLELEEAIESQLLVLRATLEAENRTTAEIDAAVATERGVLEAQVADERAGLLARRAELTQELQDRIREQEALLAQVATQRQLLSEGDEVVDPGRAELDAIANQQRIEDLFAERVLSGYRAFSSAANARSWDEALGVLGSLEAFLVSGDLVTGDAAVRQTHLAMVTNLTDLVRVAAEGWPEDAMEDVLPGWSGLRERIAAAQASAAAGDVARAAELYEAAITEIPGVGSAVGLLAQQAEERSLAAVSQAVARAGSDSAGEPERLLEVLTIELSRGGSEIPDAVRELTAQLQGALVAVERQKADLDALTALSQQQLELLRESVAGTDVSPGTEIEDDATTVESIAREIETLQGRVAASRARQAQMETEIATLAAVITDLEEEAAGLREGQSDFASFRERVMALSRRYRQRTSGIRSDVPTENRQLVRAALNQVIESIEGETAEELFPEQAVLLRTLTDALATLESARAAAAAEERLLAEVQRATERVTEEQVRLLEFSANADRDTATLLTSLVEEIDSLAATRREELQAENVAQALGVIVRADTADGTLLVQRVAALETRRARRVFVNRELPNGDRIPIADVELVAVSGENTIVRVISTIAPTITPQVNHVVYVEF